MGVESEGINSMLSDSFYCSEGVLFLSSFPWFQCKKQVPLCECNQSKTDILWVEKSPRMVAYALNILTSQPLQAVAALFPVAAEHLKKQHKLTMKINYSCSTAGVWQPLANTAVSGC